MKQFGLIGNPLSHSYSKQLFDSHFSQQSKNLNYQLYPLPSLSNFRQWAIEHQLTGINVTIPYKTEIIPHLDSLSPTAQAIGAVNCIVIKSGKFIGHNTDKQAFMESIQPLLQSHHTRALILGSGGASKAVTHAFHQLNIETLVVSRNPQGNQISYSEALSRIIHHQVIVNCTPVGMGSLCDQTPWKIPELITDHHLCYDLIYNPSKTRFLKDANLRGAQIKNGEEMLSRQAELSWKIWGLMD